MNQSAQSRTTWFGPSASRSQPVQGDRHQSADGSLRGQIAGGRQSVDAVHRQLAGSDVAPEPASGGDLIEQGLDQLDHLPLRLDDVLTPVQKRAKFLTSVATPHVRDERKCLQDRLEPLVGGPELFSKVGQTSQVQRHMSLMAGRDNGLDVRALPVQRRAADPRLRGGLSQALSSAPPASAG